MINLSTSPDRLMKELLEDKEKSFYWFKKKCGGEKGYLRMQDRIMLEAKRTHKDVSSEQVRYVSPNGNKWMNCECARYFAETGGVLSKPYAFCYYETIGSVGAFIPVVLGMNRENGTDGCIIFTSHFFSRFCERSDMDTFDAETLNRFIGTIPHLTLNPYKEDGQTKVDIRMPGGIGRGIKCEGKEWVFEIRTFLKDSQLSGKQQRQTESLRDSVAEGLYVPEEVRADRILKSDDKDKAFQREMEQLRALYTRQGVDETLFNNVINIGVWLTNIWIEMGFTDRMDGEFWQRHNMLNKQLVREYAKKGCPVDELLDFIEQCSRNLGLKPFDRQKAYDIIYERLKSINENIKK